MKALARSVAAAIAVVLQDRHLAGESCLMGIADLEFADVENMVTAP